jgi:AcrR family transcriptional regulator
MAARKITKASRPAKLKTSGGSSTRLDAPDRRSEIISATLRVIGQSGISGATMRSIAREMGLTTGVISHYFRDKNELLQEALQTCFDPWTRALEQRDSGTSWELMHKVFLGQLQGTSPSRDIRTRGRTWLSLLVQIDNEDGLWKTYRDRYELIRQRITALIRQCQKDGFVQNGLDPVLECDRLLALMDGLTISVVGEPDHFSAPLVGRILSAHLDSLRAR